MKNHHSIFNHDSCNQAHHYTFVDIINHFFLSTSLYCSSRMVPLLLKSSRHPVSEHARIFQSPLLSRQACTHVQYGSGRAGTNQEWGLWFQARWHFMQRAAQGARASTARGEHPAENCPSLEIHPFPNFMFSQPHGGPPAASRLFKNR